MHQYLLNPLSQLPGLTPQKAQALAGELSSSFKAAEPFKWLGVE
jgi:hypothetical protein